MEPLVTATFVLGDLIAKKLADGTLQRVGGVIIDEAKKLVVAWVREREENTSQIANIQHDLQQAQGSLQIYSAASVLNLGVSGMGFGVINLRLNQLEQSLKQSEELVKKIDKIDRKIDLGFYAKFRTAINLAVNAFTMSKAENRRDSALSAIQLFLEAEHIYTDYTDKEIEYGSQIIDEYLLTLTLAYLAEARCYLELGEYDTALKRFQEGEKNIRSRSQKYIEILLTSNPAIYLQPQFKGEIDLHRLTKVYQWIEPSLDENTVFENVRENLFKLAQEPNKWLESLPPAILSRVEVKGGRFGTNKKDFKQEADKRLPQVLEVMESMVETNRRFESYQTEIQAISQLGISFHDWLKLTPVNEDKPEGAELMFIVPNEPLELVAAS